MLLAVDILLVIAYKLPSVSDILFLSHYHWMFLLAHFGITLWTAWWLPGICETGSLVRAYRISILIFILSFSVPILVYPVHLFSPLGAGPTIVLFQWALLSAILSRLYTRGQWPIVPAVLLVLAGIVLVVLNASFRTTEFGPLAMFFGNLFASPILLLFPALARIPANERIRAHVVRSQYATYGLLLVSWAVFALRSFSA